MQTLVIYNEEGKIVFTNTSSNIKAEELNPLVLNIPEGKYIKEMTMENGSYYPVFEDLPKSEIQNLKEEMENAIMELSMIISMGGME